MKLLIVVLLLVSICAAPAFAQDWAKEALEKSPRHGEWVTVKHDDRSVNAFIVYPEVKQKAPAVVVIHEIFGMSDWVRTVADQLAANGYIAIAPDLLSAWGRMVAEPTISNGPTTFARHSPNSIPIPSRRI